MAHDTISKITGRPKLKRGFAAMDPARRREIAAKGGGSVPAEKRSFAKNRKLAVDAGRKGGEASRGGGRKTKRHPQVATIPSHDPT